MVPSIVLLFAILFTCILLIVCGKRNHYSYFMGKRVTSVWMELRPARTLIGRLLDDQKDMTDRARTKFKCIVQIGHSEIEVRIPRSLFMELNSGPMPTKLSYRNPDQNHGKNGDFYSASHI